MKLWIDDLREDPDTKHADYSDAEGWTWAKTSAEAISTLNRWEIIGRVDYLPIEEVAFDHDLGGDDTTRPVMLWMIENGVWPDRISIHTANPVGKEWLLGMARQYAPGHVTLPAYSAAVFRHPFSIP